MLTGRPVWRSCPGSPWPRTGFDDALFYAWRRNPDFVLNKPEYADGKILVAGPDFGIGSSREHAVWALHDYGFRVVIAPRFADIFYGNTAKNGVLAAIMPQESVELLWKLLEEEPGRQMTVNLEDRTVACGDVVLPFEVSAMLPPCSLLVVPPMLRRGFSVRQSGRASRPPRVHGRRPRRPRVRAAPGSSSA